MGSYLDEFPEKVSDMLGSINANSLLEQEKAQIVKYDLNREDFHVRG
jgi:hypothetical protein